jgi:hypothetical protein
VRASWEIARVTDVQTRLHGLGFELGSEGVDDYLGLIRWPR